MSIERSTIINTSRAAVWSAVEDCAYEALPGYGPLQAGLEIHGHEVRLSDSLSMLGKTALLDAAVTEFIEERRLKVEAELRRICTLKATLELTDSSSGIQASAFIKVAGLRGRLIEPAIAPLIGIGLSNLATKAHLPPPSPRLDKIA